MIRRHVVRNEIENQAQAAGAEPPAQASQRLLAAEILVDRVAADGKAGAANVVLAKVGEHAVIFGDQVGFRSGDAPRGLAGLPDAEEPDEIEPVRGQPLEVRVRDVVKRRRTFQLGRQLREAYARVDLEERGIPCRRDQPLLVLAALGLAE
jgi:hypothetical protein